ncbi:MAG: L,D-transpeptidase family protein [Clostridiaceae bacterium]
MSVKFKERIIRLVVLVMIVAFSAAGLGGMGKNPAYAASTAQPYVKYVIQPGDSLYKISRAYGMTIAALKAANGLSTDMIIAGKTLNIPITQASSQYMSLRDIISSRGLAASQLQLRLFVDKSDKLLTVYNGNTPLKAYHVELGDNGPGDKRVSGDHKTPEGSFYITQKLVLDPADQYLGNRWMRLSYPNIEDAQRGLSSGLISKAAYNEIVNAINNGQTPPQNTALGGGVGIHGGSTPALGTNWTFGCVGLSNKNVQDFYNYVKVGTRVTIQP